MVKEQAVAEIRAVLSRMAERYAAMDADGVVATFVDDDIVLVGTGADEVRFGLAEARAQVERDISQADDLSMSIENLRVNVVGNTAFTYADMTFRGSAGGESFEIPVRATNGLIHTGDGWRIAQFHVSIAFGEQAEGESFAD